jgi:hypothetical protein
MEPSGLSVSVHCRDFFPHVAMSKLVSAPAVSSSSFSDHSTSLGSQLGWHPTPVPRCGTVGVRYLALPLSMRPTAQTLNCSDPNLPPSPVTSISCMLTSWVICLLCDPLDLRSAIQPGMVGCTPSYPGGWGRRIAWAQEFRAVVHCAIRCPYQVCHWYDDLLGVADQQLPKQGWTDPGQKQSRS